MAEILPQQKLLLELLAMSGDIAVPDSPEETIIWRTLRECEEAKWIRIRFVSPGMNAVSITQLGRKRAS